MAGPAGDHGPAGGPEATGLRRELGLRDLVPMQILLVIGFSMIGVAGHQGGSHLTYWLLGIVLFFLPVAAVIAFCARIWPLEGGVYQWVKHGLGPFPGFLSAWNFGAYILFSAATAGILTATSLSYAIGPRGAWMAESNGFIAALNVVIFGLILSINIRGLKFGRWLSHLGTAATLFVVVLLTMVLIWHPGGAPAHTAANNRLSLTMPIITLTSLNLFSKLAFGGLCGLEQVAVFAGETRGAARAILRSAWIAAPLIGLIYILCTASLLTYSTPDSIDLVNPVAQVLDKAFAGDSSSGAVGWSLILGRAVIFALSFSFLAQITVYIAELGRLPMVAAWDHLIPAWFTHLHPRYRTPSRSLTVIGLLAVVFSIAASSGAGTQEAFQIIATTAFLCYGINYLLMFAVPLMAGTRFGRRPDLTPGFLLRVACVCGAAVTALSMFFQLVPIVDVANPWWFSLKVAGAAVSVNLCGIAVYWRGTRSQVRRLDRPSLAEP